MSWFVIEKKHSYARAGTLFLKTPPFTEKSVFSVPTPAFMPVGTCATVKGMTSLELEKLRYRLILANTYHLFLRPGLAVLEKADSLHQWMHWPWGILTDSGGFQVFSLSKLRKVTDHGVLFRSHIDGARFEMTPELSMRVQKAIGGQIVMAFDQCPPASASKKEVAQAVQRTSLWAQRGWDVSLRAYQKRFGIVQGGLFNDLREQSLKELSAFAFDGFAIGGLSVGESPESMHAILETFVPQLPVSLPRYLMGVGRPEDLIEGVRSGIDLFDCVLPTRNARNGQVFTFEGKFHIKNACYREDFRPLDPNCCCEVCRHYGRAYLRHLFLCKEILSTRVLTLHNLFFFRSLMEQIRNALLENQFDEWAKSFYTKYHGSKKNKKETPSYL